MLSKTPESSPTASLFLKTGIKFSSLFIPFSCMFHPLCFIHLVCWSGERRGRNQDGHVTFCRKDLPAGHCRHTHTHTDTRARTHLSTALHTHTLDWAHTACAEIATSVSQIRHRTPFLCSSDKRAVRFKQSYCNTDSKLNWFKFALDATANLKGHVVLTEVIQQRWWSLLPWIIKVMKTQIPSSPSSWGSLGAQHDGPQPK